MSLREEPAPMSFVPYAQGMITTPHLVIRSTGAAETVPESARRVIAAADPELAVSSVRTLEARLADTFATQRFATWLLTLFAGLGLMLTAIGVYGVLAYSVSQRVHEFGVRAALGASSGQIASAAMTTATRVVVAGLIAGIVIATALGQVMQGALEFVDRPGLDEVCHGRGDFAGCRWRVPLSRRSGAQCAPTRCRRCARTESRSAHVPNSAFASSSNCRNRVH